MRSYTAVSALSVSVGLVLSTTLLLSTPAAALGDFLCAGSPDAKSCALWANDTRAQGVISANAECVPDPANTTLSYCGYASARCTEPTDCDYGSCGEDGLCKGYIGDPCPNGNFDCQAFFFCGEDGLCGGTGAECANGDPTQPIPNPNLQCGAQVCNADTKKCNPVPPRGLVAGLPCGNDDICASGSCVNNQCLAPAAEPSNGRQGSRAKRFVLNGSGPNVNSCPAGQTACAVGNSLEDGFECIDSRINLEQCGGCIGQGGQDCTTIHGVEGVVCESGRCVVLSCAPGLVVNADESACIL